MKDKKSALSCVFRLVEWSSPVVGILVVLLSITLGTCPMSRAVRHATQLFLLDEVQADSSVDIWKTIRMLVLYLSRGAKNMSQVGSSRLWTSRNEYFRTCVCWSPTNPLPPPYSDCLSIATLDPTAHPCAPYHPASDGWVKRTMHGLHRFSGEQKVYWFSGFYLDLNLDEDKNLVFLKEYEEHDWLDWNTDAITFEAVLYDSSTSCIIYLQLGFERSPFRMWSSTVSTWAVCEKCWRVNDWMSSLLKVTMVLHMVVFVGGVPWSRMKRYSIIGMTCSACWWPNKTLLLNVVVMAFYLAVVITEYTLRLRVTKVWQVPRVGKHTFPSVVATGITHLADDYTFLLVILAMLHACQMCGRVFSEVAPAMVRLMRLLAILTLIVAPFGVALHQLGGSVSNLSRVEDSMLAVIAAFLGEIEVTGLLATTQITGLVLFLLLFTVFTLLLSPFVVEVLMDNPDLPDRSPRSPHQRHDFSDRLQLLLPSNLLS